MNVRAGAASGRLPEADLLAQDLRAPGADVGDAAAAHGDRVGHPRGQHDRQHVEQEARVDARAEQPGAARAGARVEPPRRLLAEPGGRVDEAARRDRVLARVGAAAEHVGEHRAADPGVEQDVDVVAREHGIEVARDRDAERRADRELAEVAAVLRLGGHDAGDDLRRAGADDLRPRPARAVDDDTGGDGRR